MATKDKRADVPEAKAGTDVVVVGGAPSRASPATSPAESYGLFAGELEMADDFDADADELADLFGVPRP